MKKIIIEYISKAETLLLIHPNNKLIKSYISRLRSLKNLSDIHLTGLDEIIPIIYDALSEENNESQSTSMVKLLKVAVDNSTIAAGEAKRRSKVLC